MKRLLVLLCLALFSYLVVAQTFGQGRRSVLPAPLNAFRSPMVLETPFPANPSLWMDTDSLAGFKSGRSIQGKLGTRFSTPDWYALGKFKCDSVSLPGRLGSPGGDDVVSTTRQFAE